MMVKRFVLLIPAITFLHVCVSGCGGDAYSAAMRYEVRTDPLVVDEKLGDERPNPDAPGQLPLYSPKDVLDPRNPLFNNGKGLELFAGSNPKLLDPMRLLAEERDKLAHALEQMFGTPREPQVRLLPESLTVELEEKLKLGPKTLAEGSRLYRLHCLHCHGLTGNGLGPTAKWVNPHPRDYRRGLFKFQSVNQIGAVDRKPRREDLYRTLEQGIEGTSMPAFNLLPQAELEALVSYVIHLSIRGEIEYSVIRSGYVQKDNQLIPTEDYPDPVYELTPLRAEAIAQEWLASETEDVRIIPGPYPFKDDDVESPEMGESVRRGEAIFLAEDDLLNRRFFAEDRRYIDDGKKKDDGKIKDADKEPEDGKKKDEIKKKERFPGVTLAGLKAASCVACHKDLGRQAPFKYDKWGTLVKAANLNTGVYRGGRRPIDIYYRIHSGINGSGMNIMGKDLKSDQIWDVVNFVRILPYPKMREHYRVLEYRKTPLE